MNRVQEAITIAFQCASLIHSNDKLKSMSKDELMVWMQKQYQECGYNVISLGASYSYLGESQPKIYKDFGLCKEVTTETQIGTVLVHKDGALGVLGTQPTLVNYPRVKDVLRLTVDGCCYDACNWRIVE